MKKLVILFVLAFAFNQNEIKAQNVVNPIGDEIGNVIDINATDIVLENRTTGEAYYFQTAAEMYASWSTLNCGRYRASFNLNGERQRARFNIENCGEQLNVTALSRTTSSTVRNCNR